MSNFGACSEERSIEAGIPWPFTTNQLLSLLHTSIKDKYASKRSAGHHYAAAILRGPNEIFLVPNVLGFDYGMDFGRQSLFNRVHSRWRGHDVRCLSRKHSVE